VTTRDIIQLICAFIFVITAVSMGFLHEACRRENTHNKAYIDTLQTEISLLQYSLLYLPVNIEGTHLISSNGNTIFDYMKKAKYKKK